MPPLTSPGFRYCVVGCFLFGAALVWYATVEDQRGDGYVSARCRATELVIATVGPRLRLRALVTAVSTKTGDTVAARLMLFPGSDLSMFETESFRCRYRLDSIRIGAADPSFGNRLLFALGLIMISFGAAMVLTSCEKKPPRESAPDS